MSEERMLFERLFGPESDYSRFAWTAFRPGVEIARLYGDGTTGPSAALLRYAPGAEVPPHVHLGFEHIVVLEGSQRDDRGSYGRGALLIHAPGTSHRVASERGCVVLAIWQGPVRMV